MVNTLGHWLLSCPPTTEHEITFYIHNPSLYYTVVYVLRFLPLFTFVLRENVKITVLISNKMCLMSTVPSPNLSLSHT